MFDSYKDKSLVQMKIHANQQALEIEKLREALVWCGGSADFAPGGQARTGWEKLVMPLLRPESSATGNN